MKIHDENDIMKEQVLSISQMQELKELGIDVSKASMCWIGCADGNDVYPYNSTFKDIFESNAETMPSVLTPTFTLQDILAMLPKPCYINCIDEDFYQCEYLITSKLDYNTSTSSSNPLIAAFNMLKQCKQNNYI